MLANFFVKVDGLEWLALLAGWGLAEMLRDLGYVSGPGWSALLMGAGFLAMYLIGLARPGRCPGRFPRGE